MKKKLKNKTKIFPKEFPSILRFITEHFFKVIVFGLAIAIGYFAVQTYQLENQKEQLDSQRQKIMSHIIKWRQVIARYPDYRDGYFQIAVLDYQLKDFTGAKKNLEKTLELDPNFEAGIKLEGILSK